MSHISKNVGLHVPCNLYKFHEQQVQYFGLKLIFYACLSATYFGEVSPKSTYSSTIPLRFT